MYQEEFNTVMNSGIHQSDSVTEQFEKALQEYTGRIAVAVSSGTDALTIALRSLKLDPGAKVLVPAYSFVATGSAVLAAGLTPVFADVTETGGIQFPADMNTFECVIGVTLFGQYTRHSFKIIPGEPYKSYKNHYICDNAQGFDKESCSIGTMNILSFDPMKILPAPGSGGAILTDDPVQAFFLKGLRKNSPNTEIHSQNAQMNAITAKILTERLKHHTMNLRQIKNIARTYYQELLGMNITLPQKNIKYSTNHKFPIFTEYRDELQKHLKQKGIETKVHYPYILPDLPMFKHVPENDKQSFPNAYKLSKQELSLPIYPALLKNEQKYIIYEIKQFFEHARQQ